jgi:hypothetical protein
MPLLSRDRAGWILLILLPGAAFAAWYVSGARSLAGVAGFPLDDAWIHAQFARNLATGHGFTYTGGQWVSGSTAPAWTVLLAAGYFLTRDIVVAAFALGLLAQLASGYYAARLAELLGVSRVPAMLAGTLVVVLPVLAWGAVSGMEVPLASALVLAGLSEHFAHRTAQGRRRYLGVALLGASALARPESLAIAAIVMASELIGRDPFRARAARATVGALICGAVFAPLVIFSYTSIRRPLPTTFYAKSGPGIVRAIDTRDAAMAHRNLTVHGPLAEKNFALILADQLGWGAWLVVPAIVVLIAGPTTRRPALTLAAILVVVPYLMGLTAPQRLKPDNVRYAAQLVVLAAPILVGAIWRVLQIRPAAVAVTTLLIASAGWRTADYRHLYAQSVKNIQEIHVATGRWLAANRPQDDVIAVNDVGAIAYFSGRRILDLEGLVSPEVLPYRSLPQRARRVVDDMHPDLIVIFPHWYPEISGSPDFHEIHRISVSDNLVSAGDTMIVYRPPWSTDQTDR